MKYLLHTILLGFIFFGCSSKEYFEPNQEDIKYLNDNLIKTSPLESPIKTFNRKGITLENQKIVLANGIQKTKLKDGFNFINEVNDTIISADNTGKVAVGNMEIDLEKIVIAASLKDNFLAIVFIDNSIGLYDITKKQMIIKEYYKESLANDIRISNPIFMSDIVLYPTLDGKAIVLSLNSLNILRTIIVDSTTKFNNISFFDVVNESLIAATANQIMSLNSKSVITKELEIRDIIRKDDYIYVATLDGQILKLDSALNILAQTKLKYAKVYSLGEKDDNIFALESQSYLIKLDTNLQNKSIYSFKFNNDAKSLILGDKIYFQRTKLLEDKPKYIKEDFYITLP